MWFNFDITYQLYYLFYKAITLLIVKVTIIRYNLVNIKIYKNKTCGLIKKMQGFQLALKNNIKVCLPPIKCLSRLFSKFMTEFIAFLGSELS